MANLAPEIRIPRPPRRFRSDVPARRRKPRPRLVAFCAVLLLAALALLNLGVDRLQRELAARAPTTLAQRTLPFIVPVRGVQIANLRDTWGEARAGGRTHRGIDIAALRGTPVLAAVDGTVTRFEQTPRGGIAIYQRDAAGRHAFFYAHLDRRAPTLAEGADVKKGDVLGYVGATGNASAPHLHFEIHRLSPGAQRGVAVNPYPYLLDGRPPSV
ncbi:MAG: M23 family metallopeptidase [Hyphomonadaceae bacterium]|nr:M23 family metallopeptidase [Hyphomonadaceae bacterium]